MESIELIQHDHVERCGGRPRLLATAVEREFRILAIQRRFLAPFDNVGDGWLTYEECQDVDGAVWRGNQATENDGFTLDLGCPVHITKVILTNGFRMGIRCE